MGLTDNPLVGCQESCILARLCQKLVCLLAFLHIIPTKICVTIDAARCNAMSLLDFMNASLGVTQARCFLLTPRLHDAHTVQAADDPLWFLLILLWFGLTLNVDVIKIVTVVHSHSHHL